MAVVTAALEDAAGVGVAVATLTGALVVVARLVGAVGDGELAVSLQASASAAPNAISEDVAIGCLILT
jgi:hypothetical protein